MSEGFFLKKRLSLNKFSFFFVECIILNFYSLWVLFIKLIYFCFLIDYFYLVKKVVIKLNIIYLFYVVIVEVWVVKEFERL